jgi:hypothetical protein
MPRTLKHARFDLAFGHIHAHVAAFILNRLHLTLHTGEENFAPTRFHCVTAPLDYLG